MNKLNYKGIEIQIESDTLFLVALQNILNTLSPRTQVIQIDPFNGKDSTSILENIKARAKAREKDEGKT